MAQDKEVSDRIPRTGRKKPNFQGPQIVGRTIRLTDHVVEPFTFKRTKIERKISLADFAIQQGGNKETKPGTF